MAAKRNIVAVLIIIIISVLLINIDQVQGQKTVLSPSETDPSVLQTTFEASKDTYITGANGNGSTNFGDQQSMYIGTSGTTPFVYGYNVLIDFDLSSLPPDAEIISATLRLGLLFNLSRNINSPDAEINVMSEAITESWDEYAVTWLNHPGYSDQGDPANPVDGASVWEEWDVTNIVTAWKTGAIPQYGIRLFSSASDNIDMYQFYSREYSFNAPELVVSYRTQTPTETPTPTETLTPTPTLPVSGSCPGTVKIYATRDTFTNAGQPGVNNADQTRLILGNSTDRYVFLHFPVEQVIPQDQHIYDASLYFYEYGPPYGDNPLSPWDVFVYTPLSAWDELTLTWLNQPGPFLGLVKELSKTNSDTYVINDLTFFAELWHQGIYQNDGLGLSLQDENTMLMFESSESTPSYVRPYLQVECGLESPTATPTPTETPTPTATPTEAPKTINYIASDLEVTQGIQRITNSVRLVEGKRTFVRFYVDVFDSAYLAGNQYPIDARLKIYRDNSTVPTIILPSNTNTGFLNLPYSWQNPYIDQDRFWMIADNTFIFEIPSHLTSGTLRLVGEANLDWKVPETYWFDNDVEVTVDFEPIPSFGLRVYRLKWQDTDNKYYTTTYDNINESLYFARQALPVPDLWAQSYAYLYYQDYGKGSPNLDKVNRYIRQQYLWDKSHNGALFQDYSTVRYYGLIDKLGNQGGGLADGIPAKVASGWTGNRTTFTHELGHTFNRHHTLTTCGESCGTNFWGNPCADGWEPYPYTKGRIGPHEFSVEGFYYDSHDNFEIRSSLWKDIMSYCSYRWMSDFTYHRIMDYISPNIAASAEATNVDSAAAGTDNLLVSGLIDGDTGALDLSPLFVIPDSSPLGDYSSGEFAIVLKDSGGVELARYWFTPNLPVESGICSLNGTAEESGMKNFTELVPYHPQTASVDIEGPSGSGIFGGVESGMNAPSITVTSPNGGEVFASDMITVTWNAADVDGDDLRFNVQYSPDNGTNWDIVAMNIPNSQVLIDRENFRGSSQAHIRVFASDGIHTSSDTSDGDFTIANASPSVEITQPETDSFALQGQTVGFTAAAIDPDLGTVSGDHLTWYSSLDGELGHGSQFSTASLSVGTHQITVFVNDGAGGVAGDSVQVTIYANASQLPSLPPKLKVSPVDIVIESLNPNAAFIQVYNQNNGDPISWLASSSESWLALSAASGTTTDYIYLSANTQDLADGEYSAVVTITNSSNAEETLDVNVHLTVYTEEIYLPVVLRNR